MSVCMCVCASVCASGCHLLNKRWFGVRVARRGDMGYQKWHVIYTHTQKQWCSNNFTPSHPLLIKTWVSAAAAAHRWRCRPGCCPSSLSPSSCCCCRARWMLPLDATVSLFKTCFRISSDTLCWSIQPFDPVTTIVLHPIGLFSGTFRGRLHQRER